MRGRRMLSSLAASVEPIVAQEGGEHDADDEERPVGASSTTDVLDR